MARVQLPGAYRQLFTPSRFKALYGGRGAGRSHSCASALVIMGAQQEERILCARETQRSLKQSSKKLLEDKIKLHGLEDHYRILESEIRGTKTGTLIMFEGLRTNPDAITSMEGLTKVWVEEARRVSQNSLDLLIPTVRAPDSEIWFTWNPRLPEDPVDNMFRGAGGAPPRSILFPTSYRDNPWFPAVLRLDMEWDRARDPEKFNWKWLGDYLRRSQSRVFNNWTEDELVVPRNARPYFGADWGFATDPSVLIKVYKITDRLLYIADEAYGVGVDIDELPSMFAGDDPRKGEPRWSNLHQFSGVPEALDWPIRADSARPETISYMRKRGFKMVAARKGAGSVEDGVEFMKSFDIVVNPKCEHTIDELSLYSYKVDKQTEEVLPVLADKDNNVIDACRYALEDARSASEVKTSAVTGLY